MALEIGPRGPADRKVLPMPYAKTSLRKEKSGLREKMRAMGLDYRDIAAEFARRYRLRPRAAWREAFGWSLQETADRINEFRGDIGLDPGGFAGMTASHLCEYENWPGHGPEPSGRRPTPYLLALLAAVYGCPATDLIDRRLWPRDQTDLYLMVGCLNCLMASAAHDLGYPHASEELIRAGWAYAAAARTTASSCACWRPLTWPWHGCGWETSTRRGRRWFPSWLFLQGSGSIRCRNGWTRFGPSWPVPATMARLGPAILPSRSRGSPATRSSARYRLCLASAAG